MHQSETDNITDRPLRAALALLALGLVGPAAALHQQAGAFLDSVTAPTPPAVAADTAPAAEF